MSAFIGFVTKEFRHIMRDRRTLVILFGMPAIMMILFGFAIRNEVQDVRIGIVDLANDHVTARITERLLASPWFDAAAYSTSLSAIEPDFRAGRIKEAIVFEPRFAQHLAHDGVAHVQLVTDASDPNMAERVLAYTSAVIEDYNASLAAEHGPSVAAPVVVPTVRMRFNPRLESTFLFVPGLIAFILMLVCALMTSITITREKEMGTMEVLLVSPLRPEQIIVGKVIPYVALSLVNVLTIMVLARTVFGVPLRGNPLLLLGECLLFIVCALSLGILISTRSNTQQTATMISLAGLLMPTVLLSGFIFPISSMPVILQWVSRIIPARWFLVIVRGIMIKGVGLEYLWKETLVIAAMTAVFIALSVKNFKVRL